MTDALGRLAASRYLNLETYRRDGTAVRTPVWFAPVPGEPMLVAYTPAESGKARRLRRNPRCRIAACDMRGTVSGPWLEASATLLSGADTEPGMALLNRRYWPWKQALDLWMRLFPRGTRVVLAIRPLPDPT